VNSEDQGGGQGEESAGGGVAAVDRALSILAAIAEHAEPQGLAQIAHATGLYKSTILRLMASLERSGYTQRLNDGRYALGPSAFRLGLAYEQANPLRHHVLPVLNELVAAGSESASFHIRHGPNSRMCLLRVDSAHATLDRIRPGDILPLERGAGGRVLMAFAGAEGEVFDKLRAEGFAFTAGEREPGCSGMAAPVFGPGGALAGALSLSGPSNRFTHEAICHWRPRLVEAAGRATRLIGGCIRSGGYE
jgi:DNA-binding IclR family transcriptional regulator